VVYSFYLLANQHLTPGVDPAVASVYVITGAALTFTLLNLARGTFTAVLPPAGWLALILMAVFSTTLAISTLMAGIRLLGAAPASILSTFEPLVTVVLALAFLGERLSAVQALGGCFIAAGVILLHVPAPRRGASLPG
jgi:drug/metabolite transporter (DMT)-like permease